MTDEKIIIGQGGEYPLNGILSLPDGEDGPVPAVVLVHGSGPTNMDEKIFANTPFRDLAEGLSMRGIAAIRYDKRTFIYGRKLVKNTGLTVFEETMEDVLGAVALLRNDARIDKDKVFILGHSMGAMLAPRIDALGGNFAGLILMAGSPRLLEELLFEQLDELSATHKGLVAFIIKKQTAGLRKHLAGIYEMDEEKAKSIKVMGGARAWYFKEMGEHDAPSFLEKVRKPMLVMQGGKDQQVRAETDFEKYKELLSGRDNVFFKLYPELNHLFMPSVYGELKKLKAEFKIPSKVEARVIDDIAAFIKTGSPEG